MAFSHDWLLALLLILSPTTLTHQCASRQDAAFRQPLTQKLIEKKLTNLEKFASLVKYKRNIKQILVYIVMHENMGEVLPFIDYAKTLSPTRIEFHPDRAPKGKQEEFEEKAKRVAQAYEAAKRIVKYRVF